ncbi:hypothetical protein ACFWSO_14390, partial [Streptomyces sp. NPDC058572]
MTYPQEDLTGPQRWIVRLMRDPSGQAGPGAPGPADDDAVAALRAALAGPRVSGLARPVAAVRTAGRLDDGLTLELVDRARPARALPALIGPAGAATSGERTSERLRELTRRHLGKDTERWRGVHDALAAHRGTLPELLAAVPEPGSGPAPLPPRSVPATLALLLEHTAPEHAAAALRSFPGSTVDALLTGGTLPGPVLTASVTEHGDRRSRTALARHPRLDARVLKRLLDGDDPVVGAAVYRNPRCTQSLRRALTHRLDRVPMDDTLRRELLSTTGSIPRTWHTPLLGCGDPELVARALGWSPRKVAQRYALVRVWERRGPDAVRGLLADATATRYLSREVRADAEAALGEPDGAARLRAQGEQYDDPALLPRLLAATRGTTTLRDLLNEPYAHDVRALAAANRQSPFMPKAAEELVRHEDATDAERQEFRLSLLNEPWRAGGRISGNLTPPQRRLAEEPLDHAAATWAEGMVRADLLDPAGLLRTARPAPRAVDALAHLAERDLLGDGTRAALHALVREHLAHRPAAWTALTQRLPRFTGTLTELITMAGQTAGEQATYPGPSEAGGPVTAPASEPPSVRPEPQPSPPDAPVGARQRAALSALDLLLALAPGDVPLPDDPGSLRYLARHDHDDAPGLETPDWLMEACRAHGIRPDDGWCAAPTREGARTTRPQSCRSCARTVESAYAHGILQTDDLLDMLPARLLLALPHDWRRLSFPTAWSGALAARLDQELGSDADAWLRLAAAACDAASDRAPEAAPGEASEGEVPEGEASEGEASGAQCGRGGRRGGGATWPELLDRSRTRAAVDPAALAAWREDIGMDDGRLFRTAAPTTPDSALRLLERGNHLWAWPPGTLLCLAQPEALAAVLPRLGADAPWRLAAYLLRYDRTPRAAFDHLLQLGDPEALRILATQSRWLNDELEDRLADLHDPAVDLALLRNSGHRHITLRVIMSPGPLTAGLLTELRSDPVATPPGGVLWLRSAEPDLIEEVFARMGKPLSLVQQLVGCLNLLRCGGPQRLSALVDAGRLGQAATRLCQKALAADDPLAVIQARAERELSTEKLAKRLRRCERHWQTADVIRRTAAEPDWKSLEAEHLREPIPHWDQLVNLPDAPLGLKLRHAERLPEPAYDRIPGRPELTRARLRHGLGGRHSEPLGRQLDHLLAAGHLSGRYLVHEAAPAALVLSYLNAARRRTDAPRQIRAAVGGGGPPPAPPAPPRTPARRGAGAPRPPRRP